MQLRAVIIDDELHARENLALLIESYCPSINVVASGQDVMSGKKVIDESDPDVVFLDIRMPSGAEGFELLNLIDDPGFMVVFVTAFKDYAIDAFKVNAVDYILKPIDIDELIQTVSRLEKRYASFKDREDKALDYRERIERLSKELLQRADRLAISHATGIRMVRPEEIIYLRAEGNCVNIHFKDGSSYLDTRTLKTYEEDLLPQSFFRCHRSFMVNLDELEAFDRQEGNHVIMSNGSRIPVSKSQLSDLLRTLKRN
ncbi:MAG: response regulator transcription factor [Flavobacteriales bacterium]|nr:response regulator transcription factor [Flavobacteriales bacterium]